MGVFHNRGVASEFTSPMFPDICSSEEIEKAIKHMTEKFKQHDDVRTYFVGVGMSMGANLMLRVAGEQGERSPFEAMVSLNNPIDLWLAINLMRSTPYEQYLARELKEQLLVKDGMSDREKVVYQ